ncbi:MAG TPA: hypothetical protein DCO75_09930 [Fibrobacteres bacterium]|nr:hypothetical protein [Fibrobacterota bacterium]
MASNSAACKTWCITLVSAIIVVVVDDKSAVSYVWVAFIPTLLFLFLDSYYLGLEQRFRDIYNSFIKKLHIGSATIEDVYIVNPGGGFFKTIIATLKASTSISVWPFYALLIIMICATRKFI